MLQQMIRVAFASGVLLGVLSGPVAADPKTTFPNGDIADLRIELAGAETNSPFPTGDVTDLRIELASSEAGSAVARDKRVSYHVAA